MILPRAADVLAKAEHMAQLVPRYSCNRYAYNYSYSRCRSPWSRYGRWVLTGILIFIAMIILFLFLCMIARRRRNARKFQSTPMTNNVNTGYYPPQGQPQQYPPPQAYNAPPGPPPSGATYAGNYGNNTHGANEGYYGQQNGIAQPANTYQK